MKELTLQTFRPAETKEIAALDARYLTTFTIAMTGILSIFPFVVYFLQH